MSQFFEIDLSDLEVWAGSPASIREAVFDGRLISPAFSQEEGVASTEEVMLIARMCIHAMQAGRVIDFGYWSQGALQAASKRGGPLYAQGAIAQPFARPWMFMHSFRGPSDDLPHPQYCAYLVSPLDGGWPVDIVELELVMVHQTRLLMIGDRVSLLSSEQRNGSHGYRCIVIPSPWRARAAAVSLSIPGAGLPDDHETQRAASCNVLDPLMTALLMLNTSGVVRSTVTAAPKLNKARMKNGKPPIPPYDCIDSSLYVTALTSKRSGPRGEASGGHHASPVPHIRRGHFREYPSGHRSFIRDTLVRVDAAQRAAFKSGRSHYTFGKDAYTNVNTKDNT